jgi:hypothetical protein
MLLFVTLFGIATARLWPHYDGTGQFPLHPEAIHLARSLAFHDRFADPFRLMATGPSAYLSPAFPAFLALIIRVLGTGAGANFAFRLAAVVATAAELALLPTLTEVMGLGVSPGILAWVMGLLPPVLTFPDWEASYAGLLAVVSTIRWWIMVADPEASWVDSALFGLASGALLLTNATAFPVIAVWFSYSFWKFRSNILTRGRWAAFMVLVAILTPWTVRNYYTFHRFVPFRTALGLALSASNNDCALVGVRQSEASGCFNQQSPNHNRAEAAQAQAMGEAEYDAMKRRVVIQWIANHHRRFITLTGQRIYAFWLPHETESPLKELFTPKSRRKERLTIYVATILSIVGLAELVKRHRSAFWVFASWLVLFPLIYYVALFEDRYRYPILWITFVCAGYALSGMGRFVLSWLTFERGSAELRHEHV